MTILRTEDSLKVIRKLSDWIEYIDAPYMYKDIGGVLEWYVLCDNLCFIKIPPFILDAFHINVGNGIGMETGLARRERIF